MKGMHKDLFWDDVALYTGCMHGLGLIDQHATDGVMLPAFENYEALREADPDAHEGGFDSGAAFQGNTIKELWKIQYTQGDEYKPGT